MNITNSTKTREGAEKTSLHSTGDFPISSSRIIHGGLIPNGIKQTKQKVHFTSPAQTRAGGTDHYIHMTMHDQGGGKNKPKQL